MGSLISYPDNVLTATLSGSGYTTANPLSNILNPALWLKARTTSVATNVIDITFPTAQPIKVFGLLAHNLSINGWAVAEAFSDAARTVPNQLVTSLQVNAFNPSLGAVKAANCPKNIIYCFPTPITSRYWRVSVGDIAPSTYMEFGRVWLSPDCDLISIVEYGASLTFESRDRKDESIGGIFWGTKQPSRRVFTGSVPNISPAVKRDVMIMQNGLGTVGEFMWVPNPLATSIDMMLESFPANFKEISPVTYASFNSHDLPLSVQEIIG